MKFIQFLKKSDGLFGMGRIGRLRFLSYHLASLMLMVFVVCLLFGFAWLYGKLNPNDSVSLSSFSTFSLLMFLGFLLGNVVSYALQCLLAVRRLHDLGRSGWWSLFYCIGAGFFFITVLTGALIAAFPSGSDLFNSFSNTLIAYIWWTPIIAATMFLFLLCFSGQKTANAYGSPESSPSQVKHWAWIVFSILVCGFSLLVVVSLAAASM